MGTNVLTVETRSKARMAAAMILAATLLLMASFGRVQATAAEGYLPWLGPSPLRFAAPVSKSVEPLLPPLQMTNPVAPKVEAQSPIPPPPAAIGPNAVQNSISTVEPDLLGPQAPPETLGPSPEPSMNYPAVPPLAAENLVYFLRNTGSNAASALMVLPAFVPPPPPNPMPSSATYHSAPAPP